MATGPGFFQLFSLLWYIRKPSLFNNTVSVLLKTSLINSRKVEEKCSEALLIVSFTYG